MKIDLSVIVINLISAIIIFFLGIIYSKIISKKIREHFNVMRKIFPFQLKKNNRLVLTFGYVKPEKITNYSVEQGDLTALLSLKDLIELYDSNCKIEICDSISIKDNFNLYKNLFILSGPKWNKITEYFIGRLGSPITFNKNPAGLLVKTARMNKGIIHETIRREGEIADECYGVVIGGKIKNNISEEQNIMICAGRTTLSTNGSLLFLRQIMNKKDEYKELEKRGLMKSLKKWGILLKVNRKFSDKTRIVRPLQSNDVSIEIISLFLEEDFLKPYEYRY